jgi:hypothetical protein
MRAAAARDLASRPLRLKLTHLMLLTGVGRSRYNFSNAFA